MVDSSTTPKTVLLRGSPTQSEGAAKAGENIVPGMLVDTHTDGTIKKHAVSGAICAKRFAREADYVGNGIDTIYSDGECVVIWDCKPGDWVYAWIAAGEDVGIGALLQSNGNGSLGDIATNGRAIARALEAVDNAPGNGGLSVRIKVEVI